MFSACDDCVSGVSAPIAMPMAWRTSGGRLVDVWVMSSIKLSSRNCIFPVFVPALTGRGYNPWRQSGDALSASKYNSNLRRGSQLRYRRRTCEFDNYLSAFYFPNLAFHPVDERELTGVNPREYGGLRS